MFNYYTHLDKLTLSFTQANFNATTSLFLLEVTNDVPDYAKDYYSHYAIHYRLNDDGFYTRVAYFHKGLKLHPNILILAFEKETLYKQNFQDIFDQLRSVFELANLKINTYEIAIDTNEPLTLRYEKLYKSGQIKMKSNYKSAYSGDHEDRVNYGLKKALKYETKYIKPRLKKSKGRAIKIYHKTNELKTNTYKSAYTSSYLQLNGINMSKPIYRMELNGNNNNSFYKPHRNQTIALDLNRLTDSVYLTSVFNHFSVFDHSHIIDTKTGVPGFVVAYVDNIPRVFKEKDNYNKIIENINENLRIEHYKAIINEYQTKLHELTYVYSPTDDSYDDIFRYKAPIGTKIFDMFNDSK